MTRNGKIARLPDDIREELNRRLERNIPGITLVEWLNSLPAVQEVLRDLFDGNPVIPQNLSQWRQGGFAEWQARNDLFEGARDAGTAADDLEMTCGLMADRAAQLLAARFAIALAEWNPGPDPSLPAQEDHDPSQNSPSPPSSAPAVAALKPPIPLARAIAQMRRGDRDNARLKMDQYRFNRRRLRDEANDTRIIQWTREDTATAASQASAAPPSVPSVPAADIPPPNTADTQSHSITPLSSPNTKPRRVKIRRYKSPSPTATSPPSFPSPTLPDPPLPTEPVSEKNLTEIPPSPSPAPAPPSLSDWEMRNRPLPTDTPPAWRIQLPIKTIPPWQSPQSYEDPPPPKRARMAY